jgi:hypothetical protein
MMDELSGKQKRGLSAHSALFLEIITAISSKSGYIPVYYPIQMGPGRPMYAWAA